VAEARNSGSGERDQTLAVPQPGRVPIHFHARALQVFGEIGALEDLLDSASDQIGLLLMDQSLPQRVRPRKKAKEAC
jgi:hypothetical protein